MQEQGQRHRTLVQSRAEETRTRILQTAREHFAEHGFAGANIRDIAAGAATTHSQIRYHFGTKDRLWREAVRDMFEGLRAGIPPLVPGQTPRERFVTMVRHYCRYCAEHPEHARITVSEAIRGGERLEWMVAEFVKGDHAWARQWMAEAMDAGLLPRIPIHSFLYAYVGMMQLPFALANEARLASGHDFMTDEAIEAHADAVIALLLRDRPEPA